MPKIIITTDNAGVLDKLVGLGINMNVQIEPDGAPAPVAPKVPAAPAAAAASAPTKAPRKREPVKRTRAVKAPAASPVPAGSTEDRARKIHAAVKIGAAATMGELEKHLGLGKIKIRGVVESMKQNKFGDELRLHMAGARGDAVYGVTSEQAKQRHAERTAKDAPPVGPVKKRAAVKRRVVEREPTGAE